MDKPTIVKKNALTVLCNIIKRTPGNVISVKLVLDQIGEQESIKRPKTSKNRTPAFAGVTGGNSFNNKESCTVLLHVYSINLHMMRADMAMPDRGEGCAERFGEPDKVQASAALTASAIRLQYFSVCSFVGPSTMTLHMFCVPE